jgi:hypothetical protein
MSRDIRISKLLFGLSLFVIAFYSISHIAIGNIYRYAVVGVIYELLWLPMLFCLVAIPLFGVLVFIKNKGEHRVYAALAILLVIASFIVIFASR